MLNLEGNHLASKFMGPMEALEWALHVDAKGEGPPWEDLHTSWYHLAHDVHDECSKKLHLAHAKHDEHFEKYHYAQVEWVSECSHT